MLNHSDRDREKRHPLTASARFQTDGSFTGCLSACVLPNPSDTLHGLLSPQRIIGYRSTHRLFELEERLG